MMSAGRKADRESTERQRRFQLIADALMRDAGRFVPGVEWVARRAAASDARTAGDILEIPAASTDHVLRLRTTNETIDRDERLMLQSIEAYFRQTFDTAMTLPPALIDDFYRGAPVTELEVFIDGLAKEVWKKQRPAAGVVRDVVNLLEDLAALPYEGHRASVAVALSRTKARVKPRVYVGREMIGSKKTARLFSGYSNLLSATLRGELAGVVPLFDPLHVRQRAYEWFPAAREQQPLVRYAKSARALVLSLAENGDMALFAQGRLVAIRQAAVWRIVASSAFTAQLNALIAELMTGKILPDKSLANWITMASLTMNYRRTGALLVVVRDRVPEALLSRRVQSPLENAYQWLLVGRNVRSASNSLLLNAMTLDGATFVSPRGVVLGFGQIINSPATVAASEGARSRAAAAASMYGVAVKISADGPITIYSKGVVVRELLPRPKTPSLQVQPLF